MGCLQVSDLVGKVPGTGESVHEVAQTGPELEVRLDPRRAGELGISPREVARSLETGMLGRAETHVQERVDASMLPVNCLPHQLHVPRPIRPKVRKNAFMSLAARSSISVAAR